MKPKLFKHFVKDVESLYYKTRLSSIEDCFIRLSQEEQYTDLIDFTRWINSQKKSKGKNSIYSNISVPEIFSAFDYLYNVTSRFSSIQGDLGKFRGEIFNQNPKIIEIIGTMNSLLTDPMVNSILVPFRPAIELISKTFPIPPFNESMVKKDLTVLIQSYNNRSTQEKETFGALFTSLLDRFGRDIGGALENSGRKDLADKIVSGKILFRPDLLSQVIPVGYVDFSMGDKIRDILSHIMYGNRSSDAAYEYIKKEALDFVGTVDNKQHELQREKDVAEQDLESIQIGNAIQKNNGSQTSIKDEQWLHPRSLAIISATLYAMYKKIKG